MKAVDSVQTTVRERGAVLIALLESTVSAVDARGAAKALIERNSKLFKPSALPDPLAVELDGAMSTWASRTDRIALTRRLRKLLRGR